MKAKICSIILALISIANSKDSSTGADATNKVKHEAKDDDDDKANENNYLYLYAGVFILLVIVFIDLFCCVSSKKEEIEPYYLMKTKAEIKKEKDDKEKLKNE